MYLIMYQSCVFRRNRATESKYKTDLFSEFLILEKSGSTEQSREEAMGELGSGLTLPPAFRGLSSSVQLWQLACKMPSFPRRIMGTHTSKVKSSALKHTFFTERNCIPLFMLICRAISLRHTPEDFISKCQVLPSLQTFTKKKNVVNFGEKVKNKG